MSPAPRLLFLDSSALVKLVVEERETAALRRFLPAYPTRVSSILTRVELLRSVARAGLGRSDIRRAEDVLARLSLIPLDEAIVEKATRLPPPTLRTGDAIQLATALSLAADLDGVVAYDARLLAAAGAAGVRCWSPR